METLALADPASHHDHQHQSLALKRKLERVPVCKTSGNGLVDVPTMDGKTSKQAPKKKAHQKCE
jgi:hypothetical protein